MTVRQADRRCSWSARLHPVRERWRRDGIPADRRGTASAWLTSICFVLPVILTGIVGRPTAIEILLNLVLIAIGMWARTWGAVTGSYCGFVVPVIALEVMAFIILGPSGWEARNAARWPGDEPVLSKLVYGNILDDLIIGTVVALQVGVGVAVGRSGEWLLRIARRLRVRLAS